MSEMVYIIDDDAAVRNALCSALERRGFSIKAFDSAQGFLRHLLPGSPEAASTACLVADVNMPGMTGTQLHDELIRRGIRLPLIFVTGHGTVPLAVASMKKGAVDFLQKPFNSEHLCAVVSRALERARTRSETDAAAMRAKALLARLSPREVEVLDRIVAGRLNKQIAGDLNISIKTVEAHRAKIMEKTETRAVADLIKMALAAKAA